METEEGGERGLCGGVMCDASGLSQWVVAFSHAALKKKNTPNIPNCL